MSKIVKIEKSPRKGKRYRVDNDIFFDFGQPGGRTYIDHLNKKKRDNYKKCHYSNSIEKHLIDTLTPSPALFSYYLLWGQHGDIMRNIDDLNKLLG